ncbi:hypothetical protein ACQKOH_20975 [Sphingomonas sp. NPDC092331]|uniref:hypothetical protein n=1 Tax=unclassified Sphingomonas TaxID=196159 RepID=UPI0037F41C14
MTNSGARRRVLVLACLSLLMTTTACVTVDLPDRHNGAIINPNASNNPAKYSEAMENLQTARSKLLSHARTLEAYDAATRVVVIAGVTGAGIVASTQTKPARDIGKFLTGAAVGFIANQNVNPVAISQVYRAGVTNLECIRAAALRAHGDVDGVRFDIARFPNLEADVESAIATLEQDITEIEALPLTTSILDMQATLENTHDAVKAARVSLRELRRFNADSANDTLVGERVLAGVSGTMDIVNFQAQQRTPDVAAIFQSGAIFSSVFTQGADWTTQIANARSTISGAFDKLQSVRTKDGETQKAELKERLIRHALALKVALNRVPDLSVEGGLTTISQCRTIISVLQPVTVSPNPIALTAGGDAVTMKLGGTGPHAAEGLPTLVSFDPTSSKLKAADAAPAGDYSIHFVDRNGVASPDIQLKVTAKAAGPAAAPAAAPVAAADAPAAPAAPAPAPAPAPAVAAPAAPVVLGGPPPTPPKADDSKPKPK